MAASEQAVLFGRERETERLAHAVGHLDTRGGALLVRGDAGIGKSALLEHTAALAARRGIQLLQTIGVECEAQLPFAGLHQVLAPLLAGVDELPGPQRQALLVAFGLADGRAPELFLVGLAALTLISEAAARSPVLVVIEDAQWLDRSTAGALAFLARRLESEPVLLVAALRDGTDSVLGDAQLPEVHLEALDAAAADALLQARAPSLSVEVRERLLREAAGNPLALVELPVTSERAWERAVLSPWLPLTARLEGAFTGRAAGLGPSARALLLVLAVDDHSVAAEVLAAAAVVRGDVIDPDDLDQAVASGFVDAGSARLRFRHPLMRSALYQSATMTERHAAHAAMAEIVEDPDRRAWHRAASTMPPDEQAATELEAMASRAQRRGAAGVAVAALERAAQLSADGAGRGRRLLDAAALGFELGRPDLVGRLVGDVELIPLEPRDRAHLLWLRGVFDGGQAGGVSRLDTLIQSARELAGHGDHELALKVLWSAAIQCWWSDPGSAIRDRIVRAVGDVDVADDDPVRLAVLAFADPLDSAAAVLEHLPRLADDADAARIYGTAANALGAFEGSAGLLSTSSTGLRAEGRLGLLARALTQQAWSASQRADLTVAIPAAEEAERLATETAQPTIRHTATAVRAMLAALRGDQAGAAEHAAQAEGFGMPIGARALLSMVQHARGVAALADGLPVDALEHLRRAHDPCDPAYHSFLRWFTVADLADAAYRSGRPGEARPALAELEAVIGRTPIPLLEAAAGHARAVLADDDRAEALFGAALRAQSSWPFLRARGQLALGAWLRRHRRAAESRAPLRAARDTFDALGTIPWSERARQELRASGETSRRRAVEARDQLTPQELEIAQLAASGLTNPEIAQRLFISPRTVSSHLYRIFPKLGIASRSELRPAIAPADGVSPHR